jgi:hypothetical protein
MPLRAAMALTIGLCVAATASIARAHDPQHPSALASEPGAQQAPVTPTAPSSTPAAPGSAQDAKPKPAAEPETPSKKPRKVISNEDLEGGAMFRQTGLLALDLSGINDCDRNCFERVHNAAGNPGSGDLQWKHELLQGIEKVRADGRWQAALLDIAHVKEDFCRLEREKNDDLAKYADPRNVTEAELKIDEDYQRKFEVAQKELTSALVAADLVTQKYKGIVVSFMSMQRERVVNAACVQPRPAYRLQPDDADDP